MIFFFFFFRFKERRSGGINFLMDREPLLSVRRRMGERGLQFIFSDSV